MERIYECNLSNGESKLFKTDRLNNSIEFKTLIGKTIELTYGNVIEELKTVMIEYIIKNDYLLEELGCELKEIPIVTGEENKKNSTFEIIKESLIQLKGICGSHKCNNCPCKPFCPHYVDSTEYAPTDWELE